MCAKFQLMQKIENKIWKNIQGTLIYFFAMFESLRLCHVTSYLAGFEGKF